MNIYETIREFRTPNFTVTVDAVEDPDVDLSWDETGDTLEKLNSGEYVAFAARVRVVHADLGTVGEDYLGGCIYSRIADFQDHRQCAAETRRLRAAGSSAICGSYFADLIKSACAEARQRILSMQAAACSTRVRT